MASKLAPELCCHDKNLHRHKPPPPPFSVSLLLHHLLLLPLRCLFVVRSWSRAAVGGSRSCLHLSPSLFLSLFLQQLLHIHAGGVHPHTAGAPGGGRLHGVVVCCVCVFALTRRWGSRRMTAQSRCIHNNNAARRPIHYVCFFVFSPPQPLSAIAHVSALRSIFVI